MKTVEEFKQHLENIGACEEAREWADGTTPAEAWERCERGDWLLWWSQREGLDLRTLTLAKGRCAETVIHLMKDQRSKDAVRAAIDFGQGSISADELRNAAAHAAAAAASAAYAAAYADAYAAAASAAAAAAYAYAASAAAAYAAAAAERTLARSKARKENQMKTANIVRQTITPTWL